MPEPARQPFRMNARGINLTQPIDQMPEGDFPFLQNVRALQQGGLTSIPGQIQIASIPGVHSVRRLDTLIPSASHVLILGDSAGNLYTQVGNSVPVLVDTGYSGNPLSLIRYRPDQATQTWMYVGDYAKMSKVSVNGVVQHVGIAPPTVPMDADIHSFTYNQLSDFTTAAGWSATGIASAISATTRGAASATTISAILYDSGTTGYATVAPASTDNSWLEEGARILVGGSETTQAQEVTPPISATTIAGIVYDSGATGAATIVLADKMSKVQRNSLIQIGGETIRVLSVTPTTDPSQSPSLRVVTAGSYSVGNAVTGITSFRAHFFATFAAGASIATNALTFLLTPVASPANDTGLIKQASAHDFSKYTPDDYMHISLKLDVAANLISGRLLIDVDASTNDFTRNYYEKIFTATDLATIGNNQWHELFFKISDLVRIGDDFTRTLAQIAEIGIELTVSATTNAWVSSWWCGGTYGPDILPGSPQGLIYRYRYRSSTTGAKSLPGPATRYQIFPHRQQVTVTVTASPDPQVDTIDIERLDPNLQASGGTPTFTFVESVVNNTSSLNQDNLSPAAISANPPLETNVIQPFPVLGPPQFGQVNVVGTQVTLLSGTPFPTNLVAGSVILINGVAYQTYGQPLSASLQLVASAGVVSNKGYELGSPVLAGTGLPFVFGPLEGPTASFSFALGDVNNPGTLYWTNGNDPDSAASTNSIEISPPSEPLVSGAVWNNYVFVGSRERLWMIQPTFDQPNLFTPLQIPAQSGPWTPWTMKPGLDGVYYLGRDGVYRAVPYAGAHLVSPDLWPIFPHQGNPGVPTNGLNGIDMDSSVPRIQPRISVAEEDVYFNYLDSNLAPQTLRYSPGNIGGGQPLRGWWPESHAHPVIYHYFEEVPFGGNPRLLELTSDGLLMSAGGVLDGATDVNSTIQTPALNNGDSRGQKLYMDTITDMVGAASLTLGFNFNEIQVAGLPIAEASREQFIVPVDSILYSASAPNLAVNLPIYINITGTFTFTAASGTSIYEFQPCFCPQPYLVENVVTQFTDHGIAGWKTPRYCRMGYIAAAPLELTITTNENTTAQYTLPTHVHLYTFDFNLTSPSLTAPGIKGRMHAYNLRSPNCVPFVLFREESYVKMKHWRGQEFSEVRMFLEGP